MRVLFPKLAWFKRCNVKANLNPHTEHIHVEMEEDSRLNVRD
jgi:hypothetical protein